MLLGGSSYRIKNKKILVVSSSLLFILTATDVIFPSSNADTTMQNCLGCVNNTSAQILTIFNFQTTDYPFLAGNGTFLITPNPYAHTTNATDYLDLTTWFNFVVSDGDRFDKDPTPGIIELIGVNNGTYSIMQIKSSPGFGTSTEPSAADEILGTTGFAYSTGTFVNFTGNEVHSIDPPLIDEQTMTKLTTQGGAKINGISLTSANDLPAAKMVNSDQKRVVTPPTSVVFTSSFAGNTSPSTLFNTLGIPTYSAPKDTTSAADTSFVPPLFVAPKTGGGKFIMSPVIDEITTGSNVVLRFDKIDQGTTHPMLDTIDLPLNTQASNVGISVQIDTSNPTGIPIPSGNVALYLNVDGNGSIDLSDSNNYSSNPVLYFNLEKSGTSCPTGVTLYLEDGGHWHEVTPKATLDSTDVHTCAYHIGVEHFSSYLIGTESTGGHDHGGSDHADHTNHATGHSGHSGHGGHSHGGVDGHEGAYAQITMDLNIFEIEYDLSKGIAKITVGSTGSINDLEVQIYSKVGGKRMAKIASIQPVDLFTQGMKKYIFEVPLENNEVFFRVSVEDNRYNLNQSVKVDGSNGKVIPWFANIHDGMDHSSMTEMNHSSMIGSMDNMESGFATKFNGDNKIITYKDSQFQIRYEMAGGIIGVEIDEESKSAKFLLDYVTEGDLLLQVPRDLVDADNDNFVVLLEASPEREVDYEVISSTVDYYTLKVNLPEDAKTLIVIGTKVVPEFGMISVFVLTASLASIVIILRTQRHILKN